jgi:nicotinamide riboside kinase
MGDQDYKFTVKTVRRKNPFEDKLISELVYDVMCLIHSYDWYASDDTGEETYRADVNYFKKKWLNMHDEKRVRELIDEELAEIKEELLKALVVNE